MGLQAAKQTLQPPPHVCVDLGVFSFDDPLQLGVDDLDELGVLPDRRRPMLENTTLFEMME